MGLIDSIKRAISPTPTKPVELKPAIGPAVEKASAAIKNSFNDSNFKAAAGPPGVEASKQNYEKNGHHVFDLNTPQGREGLVIQSPQIDNIDGGNDSVRCGAACVVDALVLDGDPKANAGALSKVVTAAEKQGAQFPPEQKQALEALRSGKMTPTQAAHLQELVLKTATYLPSRPQDVARDNAGLTPNGMMTLLSHLKTNGGLKNAANMSFIGEVRKNERGQPYNHWTLTVRDKQGLFPTHVDPWPNARGQKTLTHEEPPPMPSWDSKANRPNDKLQAEVNLSNDSKSSLITIRTRGAFQDGKRQYIDVRTEIPHGAQKPPDPEQYRRTFRDVDTHEVLSELP